METIRKILAPVITVTSIVWIALFAEKIGLAIGLWDGALLHPFWGRLLLAFGMSEDSVLWYALVRYAGFVAIGFGMVVSGIHWLLGVGIKVKDGGGTRAATETPGALAQSSRNVRCPKCRRDMTSEDRSFGICGHCRSW